MTYRQRRTLRGVSVVRVTLVLSMESHADLQAMKGSLGNSEAVERLIAEKKARLARRRAKV